ncbi:MAG: hypothetical protein AAB214_18960, partial [Fibrobacterota bacterium]
KSRVGTGTRESDGASEPHPEKASSKQANDADIRITGFIWWGTSVKESIAGSVPTSEDGIASGQI